MSKTRIIAVAILFVAVVRPAAAQIMDGPQGSVRSIFGGNRPVDPNRVSQRLSLDVDLSGGYDSNSETAIGADPESPFQDVMAGSAMTGVQYWRGRANRYLEASGQARINYETTTNHEVIGGELLLQGSTNIGPRLQLSGGGLVNYDPTALTLQFGPGLGDTEGDLELDHAPPPGVVDQPWLATSGYVNAIRNWSARHSTTAEYRTSRRDQPDLVGLEDLSQQAVVAHAWMFRPSAGMRLSYQFDDHRQQLEGVPTPPLRTSTVEAGLQLQRRFSSIRTLSVEITGGAARAERSALDGAAELTDFLPVASASLGLNLTGVWSLNVDASHYVNVLEGVTPEAFATTAGNVQLLATMSDRLSFSVSGTYSKGGGLRTRIGAFEAAQGMAQVQYGFGLCCGVFGSYSFYNHRLNDLVGVPAGFPERYTRHVARVGFTYWLPLYGAF